MIYEQFIQNKSIAALNIGFKADENTYPKMIKDHQRVGVTWALKRGRAALFFDTGLGKTLSQLTWGDQVARKTGKPVLLLAPLAVSKQTLREAEKFGIWARIVTDQSQVGDGINITNYEKIHHFDCSKFGGVILDESSILKGINGKTRMLITDCFANTPYKLSCTATPSPNDFMELGTQSEFLGIMSQVEMLAMFFIHDGGETSKWRLKGHGKKRFFEWLATWGMFLSSPAQLGFDSTGYDLPELVYHNHIVDTTPTDDLFATPAMGLLERNKARKDSVVARCEAAAAIVNAMTEPCMVWCNRNDESDLLESMIHGAVSVSGSDTDEHKTDSMINFADNKLKCLISKPKICGFGLNFQGSNTCVFVGLSDSWESLYQAIRRQWRFGQTRQVHAHIISADTESGVIENIRRKDNQHKDLKSEMDLIMESYLKAEIFGAKVEKTDYTANHRITIPSWMKTA